MKKFLSLLFLLIFISIFSINYQFNEEKIKEPVFIGHVYGEYSNSDVPYNPLKKVIKKNNIDFIIFGGDITKNHKDFYIFDKYFANINKLVFEYSFTKDRNMDNFFRRADILSKHFHVDIQKSYYNQKHQGKEGFWGGFIDSIVYCVRK